MSERFYSHRLELILLNYIKSCPENIEGFQIRKEYHTNSLSGTELFIFEAYNETISYVYEMIVTEHKGIVTEHKGKDISLSAYKCEDYDSISHKYSKATSLISKVYDLYLSKYFPNMETDSVYCKIKAHYDDDLNPVSGDKRLLFNFKEGLENGN